MRISDWSSDVCSSDLRALIDLDRHHEAIAVLNAAAALAPDYDIVHYRLGNAYFELDDHEKAVAAYERAVALDPKDSLFLLQRGRALSALARYDAADRKSTRLNSSH